MKLALKQQCIFANRGPWKPRLYRKHFKQCIPNILVASPRPGGRKLAHFVERNLLRLFASRPGAPSLPQDTLPEPGPGPRPVAGPVISLSVPSAQTGALAGGGPRTVPMDSTAIRTLVESLPAEMVPGRADDFRWPQSAAPAPAPGQAATVPVGVTR